MEIAGDSGTTHFSPHTNYAMAVYATDIVGLHLLGTTPGNPGFLMLGQGIGECLSH